MQNKKEALAQFNRVHILAAAKELFAVKGVEGTSMDDIASKAEYSKSTIYVYFSGKDDLFYSIVREYMEMLYNGISGCLEMDGSFEERYYMICDLLVGFMNRDPMFFNCVFENISVDEADFEKLPVLRQIYDIGEEINRLVARLFQDAIDSGFADESILPVPAGFVFWSAISSLILIATKKEKYFRKSLNMSSDEFLKFGFSLLLNSIRKKEEK